MLLHLEEPAQNTDSKLPIPKPQLKKQLVLDHSLNESVTSQSVVLEREQEEYGYFFQ